MHPAAKEADKPKGTLRPAHTPGGRHGRTETHAWRAALSAFVSANKRSDRARGTTVPSLVHDLGEAYGTCRNANRRSMESRFGIRRIRQQTTCAGRELRTDHSIAEGIRRCSTAEARGGAKSLDKAGTIIRHDQEVVPENSDCGNRPFSEPSVSGKNPAGGCGVRLHQDPGDD